MAEMKLINGGCMGGMKHINDKEIGISCVAMPYGVGKRPSDGGGIT